MASILENDIKPIIGLETKYKEVDLLVYAKNYEGYKYLIKVNLYKEIDIKELKDNIDNIVVILPYESRELYNELNDINVYIGISNDEEEYDKALVMYYDKFGEAV